MSNIRYEKARLIKLWFITLYLKKRMQIGYYFTAKAPGI